MATVAGLDLGAVKGFYDQINAERWEITKAEAEAGVDKKQADMAPR